MSGIICWPCLMSAISVLQLAPQRWQNELNKIQEENESQPNRDPWWIWPQECLRSCHLQLHPVTTSHWHQDPGKSVAIDDRTEKTCATVTDQIVHKRIMVDLGLLKSGKVELQSTINRGNLREFLGIHQRDEWRTREEQRDECQCWSEGGDGLWSKFQIAGWIMFQPSNVKLLQEFIEWDSDLVVDRNS